MEYQYTANNQIFTVRLDPQTDGTYSVVIGEKTYAVSIQRQHDGEMRLLVDGNPLKGVVATERATGKHPKRHYISLLDGHTYELTQAERAGSRRGGTASGAGNLTSQMPGQVMQVLVANGDEVEAGQTLLILEAMKMEIRVTAPQAGVVKNLKVNTGDTVDRGQTLVEVASA